MRAKAHGSGVRPGVGPHDAEALELLGGRPRWNRVLPTVRKLAGITTQVGATGTRGWCCFRYSLFAIRHSLFAIRTYLAAPSLVRPLLNSRGSDRFVPSSLCPFPSSLRASVASSLVRPLRNSRGSDPFVPTSLHPFPSSLRASVASSLLHPNPQSAISNRQSLIMDIRRGRTKRNRTGTVAGCPILGQQGWRTDLPVRRKSPAQFLS